jgi:hypothetical protein
MAAYGPDLDDGLPFDLFCAPSSPPPLPRSQPAAASRNLTTAPQSMSTLNIREPGGAMFW